MAYPIIKTDGTQLTSVLDGTVDQLTTDLTLIGKNATAYGLSLNDNFVHLLENFANTTQPNNPLMGQLWFDTSTKKLKVYDSDSQSFNVAGGTTVSTTPPSSLSAGDFWVDSTNQQLFFSDGSNSGPILAGPIYTANQKASGFNVLDVLDVNSLNHVVVELRVNSQLLGVFSKDSFVPQSNQGLENTYPTSLVPGFNVSSYPGIMFDVPANTAESLTDGVNNYTSSSFVQTTGNSIIDTDSSGLGGLYIKANKQLVLGPSGNIEISVQPEYSGPVTFQIKSTTDNQNFDINLRNTGSSNQSAFFIDAQQQFTGIYTNLPTATLDVNGTFRIRNTVTYSGLSDTTVPPTSTSTGQPGQIVWDSNWIYVCIAENLWKRSPLSSTSW